MLSYIWRLFNEYVTFLDKSSTKVLRHYKRKKRNEFTKELLRFIGALLGGIVVIFLIAMIIVKIYEFIVAPKSLLFSIVVYMTIVFTLVAIFGRFIRIPETSIQPTDEDYTRLRRTLYQALSNTANVVGLVTPTYDGELSPPERTFNYIRGVVPIHQYFCLKATDEINMNKIKNILQKRLEQMESNLELPTANAKGYLYSGNYYCSVLVMSIKDSGGFVEIDLTFASDAACRQLLSGGKGAGINSNKDTDF